MWAGCQPKDKAHDDIGDRQAVSEPEHATSTDAPSLAVDIRNLTQHEIIQGRWVIESATIDGHNLDKAPGISLVFSGDKLTMKDQGGHTETWFFKLEPPSGGSGMIILKSEFFVQQGMAQTPLLWAYELSEKTLKIVYSTSGERPTEISDKGYVLQVLKRL